jgi:hypothetical protein
MLGALPPVRENLPGISNPKAVFEVSGEKKSSLAGVADSLSIVPLK